MARNGDGLYRRESIWVFKYKDQSGIYREKSTGQAQAGPKPANISTTSFEKLAAETSYRPTKRSGRSDQALDQWMEFPFGDALERIGGGGEDLLPSPQGGLIGIGAAVTRRPLPHHRAYGSVHGGSSRLR